MNVPVPKRTTLLMTTVLLVAVMMPAVPVMIHAEDGDIPNWIGNLAGLWSEDLILDHEFIEAMEFLIKKDIIQVSDPRVEELEREISELEREISELRQEIEPKETGQQKTVEEEEPQAREDEDGYVETDKSEYTLGDIIKVSGKIVFPPPSYGLDGSVLTEERTIPINLITEQGLTVDLISCQNLPEYDDHYLMYGDVGDYIYPRDGTYHKCDIDDDGTFEFDFEVKNEYQAGMYSILVRVFSEIAPDTRMSSDSFSIG